MKRIYFTLMTTFLITVAGFGQKGTNAIGAGGDFSFPSGEFGNLFKPGIGMYAKAMFGVGKAGQVTFTGGYSGFKVRQNWEGFTATTNVVPLYLGYRHYFDGFFVEPQLGYSIVTATAHTFDDETFTDAGGMFTGAASIGYVFNKQVEVSARYQVGGKNGSTLNLFGIRLGYNFSLKQGK